MNTWRDGASWRLGDTYVVLEAGPDVVRGGHERRAPGLNHLAFHAGTPAELDALVADAGAHGWRLLFADRHPFAGGPGHYAAYLEDGAGFEVELVADLTAGSASA
jgi:catechol 2,3-dioxygenase-like lactoylglutathione lyase family enzyme